MVVPFLQGIPILLYLLKWETGAFGRIVQTVEVDHGLLSQPLKTRMVGSDIQVLAAVDDHVESLTHFFGTDLKELGNVEQNGDDHHQEHIESGTKKERKWK